VQPASAIASGACSRLDPDPKFLPPIDDLEVALELVLADERDVPVRQPALARRTLLMQYWPEPLALVRDRRVERQVDGRDDLVGVDVVAEHVGLAGDHAFHGSRRPFVDAEGTA
jgi:hypothetical protein